MTLPFAYNNVAAELYNLIKAAYTLHLFVRSISPSETAIPILRCPIASNMSFSPLVATPGDPPARHLDQRGGAQPRKDKSPTPLTVRGRAPLKDGSH